MTQHVTDPAAPRTVGARVEVFSAEWFRLADRLLAANPVDESDAVTFGLTFVDPAPADRPTRALVLLDRVTDGLHIRPWTPFRRPNVEIACTRAQAAAWLLGNGLERARLLEEDGIALVGVFQYLYYADRALQQDGGGALARLRDRTGGIPAELGVPCWPRVAPGDRDALSRSTDATDDAERILPRTLAALRDEIPRSSPGAQLHVSHDASGIEVSVALGEARPSVPFDRGSLVPWNCCAKPQGAVAAGQLWERGLVDFAAPVTEYLPWLRGAGRETITVHQLLTHTTAVPTALDPFHGRLVVDRAQRRHLLGTVRPSDEPPGARINYSAKWAWYLLAEIVEAVDGRDYDRYLRDEVFQPCGMHRSRTYFTADEYSAEADRLPVRYISGDGRPAQSTYWFSTPLACTTSLPGASHRGPMSDLALLLTMLLHDGTAVGGTRVLAARTVAELTARHRSGLTDRYGNADWGLGLRIESRHLGERYTQFSRHSSMGTFGHYGLWTNVAFADPGAGGLVVALHFNGQTWHEQHMARMFRVDDAVYEDLGLAG